MKNIDEALGRLADLLESDLITAKSKVKLKKAEVDKIIDTFKKARVKDIHFVLRSDGELVVTSRSHKVRGWKLGLRIDRNKISDKDVVARLEPVLAKIGDAGGLNVRIIAQEKPADYDARMGAMDLALKRGDVKGALRAGRRKARRS